MAIGQLQFPSWIGNIEPAGAALLRGAQAGATIAHSFTSAFNAAENRKLAKQEMEQRSSIVDLNKQRLAADLYMQNREMRDKAAGDVDYAEWYATYGHDPVAALNAPIPQNPYAAQRVAAFKVQASQTGAAIQYANDIAEFNKRLSTLPGDLRAGFYGKINGAPSQDQWKALGAAEAEAADRFKNQFGGDTGLDKTVRYTDKTTGATVTLSTPTSPLAMQLETAARAAEEAGDPELADRLRRATPNNTRSGFSNRIIEINSKIAGLRARHERASKYEKPEIEEDIADLEAQLKAIEAAASAEAPRQSQPADNDPLGLFR